MNIDFTRNSFAENHTFNNKSSIFELRTQAVRDRFEILYTGIRACPQRLSVRAQSREHASDISERQIGRVRERDTRGGEDRNARARCISLGALIYKSDRDRGDSRGLVGDII